jgi:hypothetical protein
MLISSGRRGGIRAHRQTVSRGGLLSERNTIGDWIRDLQRGAAACRFVIRRAIAPYW